MCDVNWLWNHKFRFVDGTTKRTWKLDTSRSHFSTNTNYDWWYQKVLSVIGKIIKLRLPVSRKRWKFLAPILESYIGAEMLKKQTTEFHQRNVEVKWKTCSLKPWLCLLLAREKEENDVKAVAVYCDLNTKYWIRILLEFIWIFWLLVDVIFSFTIQLINSSCLCHRPAQKRHIKFQKNFSWSFFLSA